MELVAKIDSTKRSCLLKTSKKSSRNKKRLHNGKQSDTDEQLTCFINDFSIFTF